MKVQAILESGNNRVVLVAENEAEYRALGLVGHDVVATVRVEHESHYSYAKVKRLEITLREAPPPPPPPTLVFKDAA
jgi:hypothetical protein